jgi:hypothetical protein
MKTNTYKLIYTYSNTSIKEAFATLGKDIGEAINEGYRPMGSPSVAYDHGEVVLTLMMKKKEEDKS